MTKKCEVCGQKYYRVPSIIDRSRFCSTRCTGEYNRKKRNTYECCTCRKKFDDLACRRKTSRVYCSPVCSYKSKKMSDGEKIKSALARLKNNIKIDKNGCHLWKGAKNKKGYGLINYNGRSRLAHRLIYKLIKEDPHKKLLVCHTCDNPPCINIDHLFIGTAKENSEDMVKKNRASRKHGLRGEKNGHSKITNGIAKKIKRSLVNDIEAREIAKKLNISVHIVRDIKRNRTWKHIKI